MCQAFWGRYKAPFCGLAHAAPSASLTEHHSALGPTIQHCHNISIPVTLSIQIVGNGNMVNLVIHGVVTTVNYML